MILIIHFNKEHLKDSNCPPWLVLDYHGHQYYNVHTVDCNVPFKTVKGNGRTFTGAIRAVGQLSVIEQDGCQVAKITSTPEIDKTRLDYLREQRSELGSAEFQEMRTLHMKLSTVTFI